MNSIIDRFFPRKKDGKERNMKEHRRLERKITISVTVFMYLVWVCGFEHDLVPPADSDQLGALCSLRSTPGFTSKASTTSS